MTNPTQALDAIEQALQASYKELNTIRARDGAPYAFDGCQYVTEEYFSDVTDMPKQALAHLATLRQQVAELVAFREAHEWRPIETAPTDTIISGDVLLWDGEMVFIGYYADRGWICSFHGNPQVKRPTHWQPLPAPPTAEGGQGA